MDTAQAETPILAPPDEASALLALLCTRYPEAFMHEGETPKPLAIGITERLITELALDAAVVKDAMRLYTRRHAYQAALRVPGQTGGTAGRASRRGRAVRVFRPR